MIKNKPPMGVTGPINELFVKLRMLFAAKMYNDPENNRIPRVKLQYEIFINLVLTREKVERKSKAKTW